MTLKVLFVDDDELILRVVARLMDRARFECHFTSDPLEVPRLAAEHRVDVVVVDGVMPTLAGVEVLAQVKALNPKIVRILFTGRVDLLSAKTMPPGLVDHFVAKPWTDDALAEVLGRVAVEERW